MNGSAAGPKKFFDRLEARRHRFCGKMFEDGDGKNCVEGIAREGFYPRSKIFPHELHPREKFDVTLVISRAISKTIIRIDERDVVAELGQRSAHDRLATTDLE